MGVDADPFLFCLFNFKGIGQHLVAVFNHQAVNFLGRSQAHGGTSHVQGQGNVAAGLSRRLAQPQSSAGHVQGHVSPADDQYLATQVKIVAAQVDVEQKVYCPQHTILFLALYIELAAAIGADPKKNGVELLP